MMFRGSYFRNKLDNKPETVETDWDGMVELWRDASQVPRHPDDKDGVRRDDDSYSKWPSTPALCPAEYTEGSLRRKAAVVRWHWFGADIDNENPEAAITIDEMIQALDAYGLAYVIHTTTKSRPDRHRYRLLLPISRPIESAEYDQVWASVGEKFFGIFDHATRDPSRLFYVPARWEGAHWAFEVGQGDPLDVDRVVLEHPVVIQPKPVFVPVPIVEVPRAVGKMAEMRAKLLAKQYGVQDWGDVLDPTLSPFVTEPMRVEYRTSLGRELITAARLSGCVVGPSGLEDHEWRGLT